MSRSTYPGPVDLCLVVWAEFLPQISPFSLRSSHVPMFPCSLALLLTCACGIA